MDKFTDATFRVEAVADDATGEYCIIFSCEPHGGEGFILHLTPEGAEDIAEHFTKAVQAIKDEKG